MKFTQNLCMCMSIWMPVMDVILVCKLASIHDPFAVAVHIENSLVWPNVLSRSAFIAWSISARTQPLKLQL